MEFLFRKANLDDIPFIARTIIEAEKGTTNNLGLANFFELSEAEIFELIISMLNEEIDGCEFSISSFLVAEYGGRPVAALGGWLEGYFDEMPSTILKANLINYTFPKGNLIKGQHKNDIIKDLKIFRDREAYQFEYAYVERKYRGNKLMQKLMDEHFKNAFKINPNVKKAQSFPFANNLTSIKIHKDAGFEIIKQYKSNHPEILKYSPYNIRLLMEIVFK